MRGEVLQTLSNHLVLFSTPAYTLFSRWAELGEGLLDGLISYGVGPRSISWEGQRSGEHEVSCSLEFGVVKIRVVSAEFEASFPGSMRRLTPHPLDVAVFVSQRLKEGSAARQAGIRAGCSFEA